MKVMVGTSHLKKFLRITKSTQCAKPKSWIRIRISLACLSTRIVLNARSIA